MSSQRVRDLPAVLVVPLVAVVLVLGGCAVTIGGGHGAMGPRSGRMHAGHGMSGARGMPAMHRRQAWSGQRAARCATPPAVRGTVVRVHLMDMGRSPMMTGGSAPMRLMAHPRVVPAGWVTFVATSMGRRTHELVVLPAGHRRVGAHGRVSEQGALGEASRPCGAGAGEGLTPGTTGWVSLRLAPGRYLLLCNEPHHYARGMHARFVVR